MIIKEKGTFKDKTIEESQIKAVETKTAGFVVHTEKHTITLTDGEVKQLVKEVKKNPLRALKLVS